jgi:dynein heavy chain, axonemal
MLGAGKKIPDYWEAGKRLLSDATRFLDSLMGFDKDNIPDAVIRRVEPYIGAEEFTPEAVSKVSKACTSICMWVRAMYVYHNVALGVSRLRNICACALASLKWCNSWCVVLPSEKPALLSATKPIYHHNCQVAPKRAALAAAQEALDRTRAALATAQTQLAAAQAKITTLETQFEDTSAKKRQLATQVEECTVKLQRADKLVGGLGGERTRWAATVKQLQADLSNLIGDVVISAGAGCITLPCITHSDTMQAVVPTPTCSTRTVSQMPIQTTLQALLHMLGRLYHRTVLRCWLTGLPSWLIQVYPTA